MEHVNSAIHDIMYIIYIIMLTIQNSRKHTDGAILKPVQIQPETRKQCHHTHSNLPKYSLKHVNSAIIVTIKNTA